MHDEVENVARAFYLTTAEYARGWEREPESLKNGFREKAKLAINALDGFRQQTSASATFALPLSSDCQGLRQPTPVPEFKLDAPGFLAVLTGPKHTFHVANMSYRRLTGHRALTGRSVRDAIPEIEGQGYFETLDAVYETGHPYMGSRVPLRIRTRRNGLLEDRVIDFAYKPIVSEKGERLGILIEGRDVTAVIDVAAAIGT